MFSYFLKTLWVTALPWKLGRNSNTRTVALSSLVDQEAPADLSDLRYLARRLYLALPVGQQDPEGLAAPVPRLLLRVQPVPEVQQPAEAYGRRSLFRGRLSYP